MGRDSAPANSQPRKPGFRQEHLAQTEYARTRYPSEKYSQSFSFGGRGLVITGFVILVLQPGTARLPRRPGPLRKGVLSPGPARWRGTGV